MTINSPATGFDREALAASRARSFAAAREWRAGGAHRALEDAFAGCPAAAEAVADRAERLLAGEAWLGELIAPLVAELAADPFFEAPFRVARDPLRIGAVVFEHPLVSISAAVLSAAALAALPPPRTVVVPGRLSVTRYARAGGARLRLWRADPAPTDLVVADAAPCRPAGSLAPEEGAVVRMDGRTLGHLVTGATADVVTIVATVRIGMSGYTREYDIADGRLLRAATLDDGASRSRMLLTLLRLSGRADAAARFDAVACEGPFFLRWAAMREWLALDARAALPRLAAMAGEDPHPEIRTAARATLAMVEARMAERSMPCPA